MDRRIVENNVRGKILEILSGNSKKGLSIQTLINKVNDEGEIIAGKISIGYWLLCLIEEGKVSKIGKNFCLL